MALFERYGRATIASALAHRVADGAQSEFLVYRGRRIAVGEVDAQAEALAASLHSFGVEPGDRVGLLLPPCPEFVVGLFAVAKLGAVAVPLSPGLTTPELRYRLRHSEAVAVITIETDGGTDYLQVFETLMAQLPELQHLVTVGEEDLWYDDRIFQYEDVLSAGAGRNYPVRESILGTDPIALLYTAGTTGKPKGVTLSHTNLLYAAAETADALGLGEDDRVVGLSALHHVFGLGPGILGCVLSGASLVLSEHDAGPGEVLDLVEAHGVTVLYGVPTLFAQELGEQSERPRNLSSLRLGLAAGAPVTDSLVRRVEEELCPTFLVGYSLTETASIVALTRAQDPPARRRATVGEPLPGTRVRILEDGVALPVESVGEVAIAGPGVMEGGYYRQPRETRDRLDDEGFFRTGDLGMLDEYGALHLVGRGNDVIIRSGFNVYPREVEDRLRVHPAVEEAAVVGVPDSVLGEAICACVIPVEGAIVDEEDLRDWCRGTLSRDKVPDQVRILDRFPRTKKGDVRRVELVRWVRDSVQPSDSENAQAL